MRRFVGSGSGEPPPNDSLTTVGDKTPTLQRIDKFMVASPFVGDGRLRLPKSL